MSLPADPGDILEAAAEAGEALLMSGAEVTRVEDTMLRIARAFGVERVEAAVLPTAIFLSGPSGTLVRRVRQRSVNLAVVAQVNQLSRDVATHPADLETFRARLSRVRSFRRYPWAATIAIAAGAGGLLALFVGGRPVDVPAAMAAGAVAQLVRTAKLPFSGSLKDFLAALAAVLPGLAVARWSLFQPGTIIVGGIMVLVPGLAMVSAIRDGLAGDLVSATARILEAGLTAAGVAAGVALPLYLYLSLGGPWR